MIRARSTQPQSFKSFNSTLKMSYNFASKLASLGLVLLVLNIYCYPQGSASPTQRIVGGSASKPGEFPHQVNVQTFDDELREWVSICGGSILSPTVILWAAHCTMDQRSSDPRYRIIAGEYDITRLEGTEQFRDVESIVLHHRFDDFSYQNDVALMFLSKDEPLLLNKFVKPIKIAPAGHVAMGNATVTGWGHEDESFKRQSPILNKLDIPIFKDDKCKEIYQEDFVAESMICAGNMDGGKDACAGDSGGPLVARDLGTRYVAGIVSWGVGCGQSGYLGVYTEVSKFTPWIEYVVEYLGHGVIGVVKHHVDPIVMVI